jgi:hypothetical protein
MVPSKRIVAILAFGASFLSAELREFLLPNRWTDRFTHGLEATFRGTGTVVDAADVLSKASRAVPVPQDFHWNWREWQELNAQESLRNAKLTSLDRRAIAAAIAAQLRPIMADLDIGSENQLRKAVLDTRIRMIDLDNDGIPEAVAQGMVNCSPTGNCPFWVFRKTLRGYKLLVESYGQTFTVQKTSTNGFRDIVVSMHGSATESGLTDYRYKDGSYHDVGCYGASWTLTEGDTVRELKVPQITPCGQR